MYIREFGILTVGSYVVQVNLVDGKLFRSLRKYMDRPASGVRADGAYVRLSLCSLVKVGVGLECLPEMLCPGEDL
jgi:hypothetical protein